MANYLLTGGAGFIGSNLARYLLNRGNQVAVLDNFSTGKRENLAEIADSVRIIEGDIRNSETVDQAAKNADGIFHLAALGSVPKSLEDPAGTMAINVTGTLHVLEAARRYGLRVVFSASSAAYGNQPIQPNVETMPTAPASPYGASKVAGEALMRSWYEAFGLETVTLRYFNVFGPRQDPHGAYAAVIPAFCAALLKKERPTIFGDGGQSRDFCYVENVCKANFLGMTAPADRCDGRPINIACQRTTTLNEIFEKMRSLLGSDIQPVYAAARAGDIRHSSADISLAREILGYEPAVYFDEGMEQAIGWYRENLA